MRIDEHGKWEVQDGVEILIEPSEEWIAINQPAPTTEQLLQPIREERNRLLAETDYIMMPDYPLADKTAWATYRQKLRDLPDTVDVSNPVYPTKPTI